MDYLVKWRAFTLIELTIVLCIISVLLLMAIPSYREFIQRDNRSLAQQALLVCSTKVATEKVRNGDLSSLLDKGANSKLDTICQKNIPNTGKVHYELEIEIESKEGKYSLAAVPVSGLAKDDGRLSLMWNGLGCWERNSTTCESW